MLELKLSQEAKTDLSNIWDYIAEDSEINADRFLAKIWKKFEKLQDFSEIGLVRNDLSAEVRSIPMDRYMIFYQNTEEELIIARVLNSSMDIQTIFTSPMH